MKIRIYIAALLLGGLLSGGCEKFLDEKSQDEYRPATVDDLQRLMFGEAYPLEAEDQFLPFLDLLTDDVKSNYTSDPNYENALAAGKPMFTWSVDMFDGENSPGLSAYTLYYKKIMGCNVVLDHVDDMIGTQAERDNLKGQALALRSYYYFMLVNLFGKPYNTPGIDLDKELGVALILESAAKDEYPARNTLAQTWKQIEDDLLASIPLLEKNGQENRYFQVTPLYPVLLLSRMYLYQEKWDLALEYAQKVIDKKPLLLNFLTDLNTWDNDSYLYVANSRGIYTIDSPEMIWGFNSYAGFGGYYLGGSSTKQPTFEMSTELLGLYKKDGVHGSLWAPRLISKDMRMGNYFTSYFVMVSTWVWNYYPYMADKTPREDNMNLKLYFSRGFRNVESYLIRAEVNAMKYVETGGGQYKTQALADINEIALSRWNTAESTFEPITADTPEEVLQAVRDERRRELCFEDHRWFDLRRYGMPEIQHVFKGIEDELPVTYTLNRGDARYTLPIPSKVIERNPSIYQNEYPNY